jgi:hypothetical protein
MARKEKKAKKSKKTFAIPSLADVKTIGVISKGWHKAKITAVEDGEGDKAAYFKWTFEIVEGKAKGKSPKPYFTTLADKSLWNLKSLLEACGFDIPKKGFDLDPNDLVGEECFVFIDHEVYEGRNQSVITQLTGDAPEEESEDEDDESEESEDEDETEESEEEESDDDSEEESEDEDESEEDEDEEEEELTEREVKKMTTDEMKDLSEKHKLKIQFKGNSLEKQRKMTIAALKKKKLL